MLVYTFFRISEEIGCQELQNNPLVVELFPSEVRFDYVNTW
ncbi:hypothetical protein T4C_10743 [Trichinella pseudospiralis]|uniref:Uncharacterized protein n=1 Tax=Trichinella pseudospiralis TaxID=6337 RepID=A0A0V1GKN7_TRIPS|nr:hypothetical protein T4C_10743 [Trichinella pseudospiralis]